ncbi:hypothetical protein ACWGNZ_00770 [Sphingomonas zeae]
MTDNERKELEGLNFRIDQTAAIAHLVARHTSMEGLSLAAIEGVAATLDELSARLEVIATRPEPSS